MHLNSQNYPQSLHRLYHNGRVKWSLKLLNIHCSLRPRTSSLSLALALDLTQTRPNKEERGKLSATLSLSLAQWIRIEVEFPFSHLLLIILDFLFLIFTASKLGTIVVDFCLECEEMVEIIQ